MITPSQIPNPYVKPRWQAPVGVMESVVMHNCRKYGMPLPVLAMPMWEGAGNRAIDLSGHGNHGTIEGADWVADGLDFFAGNDDKISLGNTFLDGYSELTLSAWVYHKTITADNDIFCVGGHVIGSQVILWRDETTVDHYAFLIYPSYTEYGIYYSNYVPLANTWTHIVLTFVGGDVARLYINGIEDGNSPFNMANISNLSTSADTLWIGGNTIYSGKAFNGIINIPSIYNTALSAAQIKFLYDNPHFMYQIPEELYGYVAGAPPVGAIMNQFQKANIGADLYNGAIIA